MDIIKQRLRDTFNTDADIAEILPLINDDGSFAGVDYSDTTRGAWLTGRHLDHVLVLSAAYLKDESLGGYVKRAMDHWFKYDFKNSNWWHNDLGVPQKLRMIMLNCSDILGEEINSRILSRLHTKIHPVWTGTNRMWFAENVIFHGVLSGNAELVKRGIDYMSETIFISKAGQDGVQADASFAQHGMQLYNHGYGKAFILNISKWFKIFNGTEFAFSPEKIKIVTDLYLRGTSKMGRYDAMDFSAQSREIVRCYQDTEGRMPFSSMLRYVDAANALIECNTDPEIKEKIQRTVDFYLRKTDHPFGDCNTAHPILKYMTHHRRGFYASVKMSSRDVKGGDADGPNPGQGPVNGENWLAGFGGYGVCVYMRDGKEYDRIFPVLDWGCLGGTTTPHVELPLGHGVQSDTEFADCASDGRYGVAAADFKKTYTYEGETVSFGGKKAYFFFDECVFHLGAELYSNSKAEFITAYDQCNLSGEVVADGRVTESDGEYRSLNCGVVFHNNKAYINLDKAPLRVKAGEAVGSYERILRADSTPKGEVRGKTFTLIRPQRTDSYVYAVMPDTDIDSAEEFLKNCPVTVIENSKNAQAVVYKNALYAVFYKPYTLEYNCKRISADKPCIIIHREG